MGLSDGVKTFLNNDGGACVLTTESINKHLNMEFKTSRTTDA